MSSILTGSTAVEDQATDWITLPTRSDQETYLKASAAPQGWPCADSFVDSLQASIEPFFQHAYGEFHTTEGRDFWSQSDLAKRYCGAMSKVDGRRHHNNIIRRKILEEVRTILSLPGSATDRITELQRRVQAAAGTITDSPDFSLAKDVITEYKTSLGKGPSDAWGRDACELQGVVSRLMPDIRTGPADQATSKELVDAMQTELNQLRAGVERQRAAAGRWAKKPFHFEAGVITYPDESQA